MTIEIRQVTDGPDYEAVKRLRYAVYVSEEGLEISGMNHDAQTLAEELDTDSFILAAFDDGEPVATIRTTPMRALPASNPWRAVFGAAEFPVPESQQFMIGRLLVKPQYRGRHTWLRLLVACYEHAIRNGFEVGFLACRPRQIQMYESVGCRRYKAAASDAQYGLLIPMVHVLRDVAHSTRMRSLLQSRCSSVAHNAELSARFERAYGRAAQPCSVGLMTAEEKSALLASLTALKCVAFNGILASQVEQILEHSARVALEGGMTMLLPGNKGTELYVILEGQVVVSTADALGRRHSSLLSPGQVFAETGFLWSGQPPSSPGATTAGRTQLLCISADGFAAIRRKQPDLAWSFLLGLCKALGERLNAAPSTFAIQCLCQG